MTRFKTLHIIEHTDYFFGTLYICPATKKATLRCFIVLEGVVHEFGKDDDYRPWKNNIDRVVEKAREICAENNAMLWTY